MSAAAERRNRPNVIAPSTVFAGLAGALVVAALLAVASGELMLAGLCLLGVSFAIFLRETRG